MHFKAPILNKEFVFKTSRSGGKGGQNVNKVSTKVQIDFSITNSSLLSDTEKEVLLQKLEGKLSTESVLQVIAQAERTQLGNKEIALKKMYIILNKCFVHKKKRKATKPSKSSVEKRLEGKKHHSQIKQMRRVGEE
ncbi:MAG: alternative ribosome rescue aminoacyl-tRNA hydrolase ArfB [Bacteroidetes bacterium]|nr:alternative ribosome rescue aminoacyl-tRNA hydrolase ArfB [Bacteroidota bacterium]